MKPITIALAAFALCAVITATQAQDALPSTSNTVKSYKVTFSRHGQNVDAVMLQTLGDIPALASTALNDTDCATQLNSLPGKLLSPCGATAVTTGYDLTLTPLAGEVLKVHVLFKTPARSDARDVAMVLPAGKTGAVAAGDVLVTITRL